LHISIARKNRNVLLFVLRLPRVLTTEPSVCPSG
jgi:hypothetical protein